MNIPYWIAQIAAIAAYILLGEGFSKKTKIEILNFGCAAETLLGLHWWLLNANSAIIASAIALIRNMIFMYYAERKKEVPAWYLYAFIIISLVLTYIFYQGLPDIFMCMIAVVAVYTYWAEETKTIRRGNMVLCLSYLAYGVSRSALVTVISEIYLFITTLVGYIKYEKKGTKSLQSQ